MLLEIRERAQGWVAWAIVILISIPFALWGIQSYLGVGGEPVVVKVNGSEITERQLDQRLQRTRMEMRERLGDAYDPGLFEGAGLREQVLQRMIEAQVLLDASRQLGLRVADAVLRAAIAQEPAFQKDGRFDKETYAQVLQYQGMTPSAFEQGLGLQLLEAQLEGAVQATAFATRSEVDQSIRLIRQERAIRFIKLPWVDFTSEQTPDEAELRAFYDANPERFQSPEQVKLSYILLSAETLGADQEVAESDVQALYEERVGTLKTPERRALRHILIALPTAADEAEIEAARAQASALRERILAGERFAVVASEASDDSASASSGGELGEIERGMLDPILEQAAFSLGVGELSDLVRSRFGYHLLEVTAIEPSVVPSLEDVAEELRQELRSRSAEGSFYDHAERLATLTYEVPDSLVPAAEELGLEIQVSEWIDRDGGDGMLANPKVLDAAFSEEVLGMGNNSELIEPDPRRLEALVVRVDDHRPRALRPFDEVRAEIAELVNRRKATTAALEAAETLARRAAASSAEQNGGLSELATATHPLETPGLVGRQSGELPAAVVREAFLLPHPGDGAPSIGTATDSEGDAFVIAVSEVRDGDIGGLEREARVAEARVLAGSLGRSDFDHFVSGLEANAKIERKRPTSQTSE